MKIAILGSYSTQILSKSLKSLNSNLEIYEADYAQIDLEIINENSQLYLFEPEFILIHETSISFKNNIYKNLEIKNDYFEKQIERLESLINKINNKLPKVTIIYPTLDFDNEMNFGNFFFKVPESSDAQLFHYNYALMQIAIKIKNLFLVDINNLVFRHGNVRDPRMVVTSDFHFTISFTKKLALSINQLVHSLKGNLVKCFILDLDNTLWGGIIGDDGLGNIQIGDLGIGKAFTEFQLWLKSLKNRGIILCVCSKNDEEIAKKPFLEHSDMVLSLDDIAVFVANWNNKVDNIKYIKSVLNISYESIVFLDDNHVERDMVQSAINDIIVPDLPKDPSYYKSFLIDQNLLETSNYSRLDKNRTEKYQAESKRKKLETSSYDLNSYLKSLKMNAKFDDVSQLDFSRISQLTQRTNQFNARTIRYSEKDIDNIRCDSNKIIFSVSLSDKFGSHGIVSCVILEKIDDRSIFIDTLLMSCRVFNRGLENLIINHIKLLTIEQGFKFIYAEWIPSEKNKLIDEFYGRIGFKNFKNNKAKLKIKKLTTLDYYIKRQYK